jgi:hypothetical protein
MFERLGYSVKQTSYVNDQGRDAIIYKEGQKYLVECKRYAQDNNIGRPEIQKFHSAIVFDKADRGFFVSSGKFTPGAIEYARSLPIELVDGEYLLRLMFQSKQNVLQDDSYTSVCLDCGSVVRHSLRSPGSKQCENGHLVSPTLTAELVFGVAEAPLKCAKCGLPMRMVNGRRGKFWGCSGYPACRSTRPYVRHHGALV